MSEILVKDDIKVEMMIYEVRGKYVMLDSDLAELYGCTNGTKDINKAVKRNIERFPERFMFQLNENEYNYLRSQIGTAKFNIQNKKFSICFYRTRNSYVSYSIKNRSSSRNEYKNNGCVRSIKTLY